MKLLCILLSFVLPSFILAQSQKFTFDWRVTQNNSCDHLEGFHGRCVKLSDCPYAKGLFKILEYMKNTGQTVGQGDIEIYQNYLKRSHCGWERKEPKVCCRLLPLMDSCAVQQIDLSNRISEGIEAGIAEFPHMALLVNEKVRGRPAVYCGGALINERYVVTAAHCFYEPYKYDKVFIRLGEHDLNSDIDCRNGTDGTGPVDCTDHAIDVNIEEKFIHERFETIDLHNDIALVRLETPVNYSRFIQPICLPDNDYNITNQTFEVSGFGKMGWNGNFSNVKLKISIQGVTQDYCRGKFSSLNPPKIIIDQQFCAGGQGRRDICHGDSGSPLIGRVSDSRTQGLKQEYQYLAGIVSYGLSKCGTPTWPGVYTRVSSYVDWIRSKMRP